MKLKRIATKALRHKEILFLCFRASVAILFAEGKQLCDLVATVLKKSIEV